MKSIISEHRIYSSSLKTHKHPYGQLIIPIYGRLNIETHALCSVVNEQKLFFLPPTCEHAFFAPLRNEFLVLDIPFSMLKNDDMIEIDGGKVIILDERWRAIKKLLLNECQDGKSTSAVNMLFSYFYRYLIKSRRYKSIEYLNQHFSQDLDLKALAAIEHYNPRYYSEWFKRVMKVSPSDYIRKLRLEKAQELLTNSDYSIMQIAHIVGYRHNSSLTRAFKEELRMTPAEYRKLHLS